MMKRKLLPVAIGMAIAGYHSVAFSDATVYGKANVSGQGNDFQYQGGDQQDNSSFESNASRFGIKGKAKILTEIRKAAKAADMVYLAPDPDREGEAIAWHLATELKVPEDKVRRVLFTAMTAKAIQAAAK